jgi:hypothetical protein
LDLEVVNKVEIRLEISSAEIPRLSSPRMLTFTGTGFRK